MKQLLKPQIIPREKWIEARRLADAAGGFALAFDALPADADRQGAPHSRFCAARRGKAMSLPYWIKQHLAANPDKIFAKFMREREPAKADAYASAPLLRYEHFLALEKTIEAHHKLSERIAALEQSRGASAAKWSGFHQRRVAA